MSNYNTNNPVPSIDPRDVDDNATVFDKLLNDDVASVNDRLGVPRKTWKQMEEDAEALVSPNVSALAALTGVADAVPVFSGPGAMATRRVGQADGIAALDSTGKVPAAQIPSIAISETFTVASQAAMLALTAQQGDVAIRTDQSNKPYILGASDPTVLANWIALDQTLSAALAAISGLTPVADRLPYFTGPTGAALAVFTAVARTLLAATTAADQRTALGLGSAAVAALLGTVSQSGGVPTGAVYERGSNANGEYVKYADGTMIQTLNVASQSVAVTTAYNSLFYGLPPNWTFPVPFVGAMPYVGLTPYFSGRLVWGTRGGAVSLTSAQMVVLDGGSNTNNYQLSYVAVGRWF